MTEVRSPDSVSDIRAMCCDACEGTGHILESHPYHDDPYYVHETNLACSYCDDTGLEIIAVEPIEEWELAPFEERG